MCSHGIDPDIVGNRVLEAVKNGELYIFTHPAMQGVRGSALPGDPRRVRHRRELARARQRQGPQPRHIAHAEAVGDNT